jgi:hypothetical protein
MLTPYDSALPGTCSLAARVDIALDHNAQHVRGTAHHLLGDASGHLSLPPVVLTAVGVAAIDDHPAWLPFVETMAERPLLVTERK